MNLFGKYADKDKIIDLGRKIQYFTLDVISDIAFGEPFGFLETDSDVYRYIETTERTLPIVMVTTVIPLLVKLLASRLLSRALPSETDTIGFGRVIRYVPQLDLKSSLLYYLPSAYLCCQHCENRSGGSLWQEQKGAKRYARLICSPWIKPIRGRVRDPTANV